MLLERVQRDLFDFIDRDPEERAGLIEFWYSANSEALSAALTASAGLSLIVNVSSFASFESLAKKLFLVADTLILRDTRRWRPNENAFKVIPIPQNYKPGYLDDIGEELRRTRPSPLTLLYRPTLYWTSDTKLLNNGYEVGYAGWEYNSIPQEFIDWLSVPGRSYLQTGRIAYAPFIPPLDMELELLRNKIFLPDYFNATPCFHQQYDWINTNSVTAILSLRIPFLDGLSIETISEVKQDYRDEFNAFSKTLLEAIGGVKGAFGSESFTKEVRYIHKKPD